MKDGKYEKIRKKRNDNINYYWLNCLNNIISILFLFKNPSNIFLLIICVIDLVLFFINAFKLTLAFEKGKLKTILISIAVMLVFFLFIEIVVLTFSFGTSITYDFNLFLNELLVSIFSSPSFIILLPIIWFVAECLG